MVDFANGGTVAASLAKGIVDFFNNMSTQTSEGIAAFGLMFDRNPLPMWVYDVSTLDFLAVNDAALNHYGYGREEFLALKAHDLLPQEEAGGLLSQWERGSEQSELNQTATWKHRKKDLTIIDVELIWNRIAFSDRSAMLVMALDATERKAAEKRIRDQASLLNMAHDAIIGTDLNGCVDFWNTGAETLYGWTSEDAVRRPLPELVRQEAAVFESARSELLKTGEWKGESKHRSNSGKDIAVSSRWTLVTGEHGEAKSILVISTDITEKKSLEAQFLRSQRLESIGTLASGIAHDLNNILAPILMSVGLLRQNLEDDESKTLLSTIEISAERGADIVKQVLTFARGAEGDRILIQPRHLVNELAKMMSQTFPRNISVRTQISKNLAVLSGDATQLHQVLLNLCVNARDAMPDGGNLIMGAETRTLDEHGLGVHPDAKPGRYVVLRVTDSGMGIPREVIDKIFDPFFTTKEQGKGTGLGLSTVIGIVRSHAGFVNVESEPGKGTTFRIYLPASDQTTDEVAHEDAVIPRGKGELILVVDDEPAIRNSAIKTLEAHGYRAYTAEDGTDALALYFQRRGEIDLVLTDVEMDLMDGIALARALKKVEPAVKIIVSSGESNNNKKPILQDLGVTGFLDKPYSARDLLSAVYAAIHAEAGKPMVEAAAG